MAQSDKAILQLMLPECSKCCDKKKARTVKCLSEDCALELYPLLPYNSLCAVFILHWCY